MPGGGTTHSPVGDAVLSPSTATAMPAWGADATPGGRPSGPRRRRTRRWRRWWWRRSRSSGIRVSRARGSAQVVPGRTFSVSGASGPDGSRNCTVTVSVAVPGLKTSISEEPPGHLLRLGDRPVRLGRRRRPGRARGPPRSRPAHELLHLRRDDTAGPRRHDGADGRDLLHLRRHVLHRHLARRQHDPLVVDRVDHAGRRQEAEIDHDRRRRGVEERDVERVGGRGGAAGEVPLGRGRALAGRLGPTRRSRSPSG